MDTPRRDTRDIFPATGAKIATGIWQTEASPRAATNDRQEYGLDPTHSGSPASRISATEAFPQHSEMVIWRNDSQDTCERDVLWNNPATGVMPLADASCKIAADCAQLDAVNRPCIV